MNTRLKTILSVLVNDFEEQLNLQCYLYTTIGTPTESTRWFQYNGTKNVLDAGGLVKELYFESSQTRNLWFKISLDKHLTPQERNIIMGADYQDIYNFFRDVKYKYLAKHWPTIDIPSEYKIPVPVVVQDIPQPEQLRITPDKINEPSEYDLQAISFLEKCGVALHWKYVGFDKYFDDDTQSRNIFTWTLSRNDISISGRFGSSIASSCKKTPIINSNEQCEIYWGVMIGGKEETSRTFNKYGRMVERTEKMDSLILSHKIKTDYPTIRRVVEGEIKSTYLIDIGKLSKDHDDFVEEYKEMVRKKSFNAGLPADLKTIESVVHLIDRKINMFIEDARKETILLDQADEIIEPTAYDLLTCITKYDPGTFENFCGDFGYDSDSRRAERIYNSCVKEWNDVKSFFTEQELTELAEIN